ncbi:alpha/beta fold hydrolase [Dethiothermospora halolimnae]|uniref:alpha/beta fold hydrolase n=1 Tax=Dethiothermospora halolimnae TaxID=3114390 RepID=UPI003CCBA6C2
MKCNIGNTVINYEVKGSGKPILLFSGFATDMNTMKNCMEPIFSKKSGWKRIYVDHPGVGDTLVGIDIKGPKDFFNTILEFVEAVIGKKERFVLAGYSFGGYISRYILNHKFNMVDGLLLINPLIFPGIENCDIDTNVKEIKNADKGTQEKIEKRTAIDIDKSMAKTNFEFLNMLKDTGHEFIIEIDNFNKSFEKPTLILTGRQDNAVGYRDAFKIIDKYPRASYCVLDKSGHTIQIEQEELFNKLVEEWLYRVEENANC